MSFKIVRDTQNTVVAFGPNDDNYVPTVPVGCSLFVEATLPVMVQPVVVPALTPRQIRLVLNVAGLRAQVEAAVGASSQDVKDMWEFSLEYRRDDPILTAMATAIGISNTQLDALFAQGALL